MNNFGVIELANAKKTSAPGWAYVPDISTNLSLAANKPANRKRARNAQGLSIGDLSARQDARIQKEVAALDRDGGKDNSIPLPHRSGRSQGKSTPNVRKILQSQKTFANHLDDLRAMQALAESNAAAASKNAAVNASKRPLARRDTPNPSKRTGKGEDTEMTDADRPPVLLPYHRPAPEPHPGDDDPLLVSRVPAMPSDEELRKLLEHPPLTYVEAAGTWEQKYPVRVFCEVCGYWGRVRCMKCGTRVCALDCLETHREECITRYGL